MDLWQTLICNIQVSEIDRTRSKVHICQPISHSFSLLLVCCELLMLCANEMLPQKLRLDPATCTAPNPSEVEDFVMRRQSLQLKEVGQMPTKTGEESFFLFFRKVLKLCHFGPWVFPISATIFSNLNLASSKSARWHRGSGREQRRTFVFVFPRNLVGYLRYPSYLGRVGLKYLEMLCCLLSDIFKFWILFKSCHTTYYMSNNLKSVPLYFFFK